MNLSSATARRAVGFRSRNASLERCAGAQLVRRDTGRTPTAPSHRCEEELEPSEHLVPNVIRLTREAYPSSYVDRPSLQQLSSEHHYPHRQHNPPCRCSTSPSRSTPSWSSPSSPRPTPLLLTSSDAQGTDGLTEQATPIYPTPDKQGTGIQELVWALRRLGLVLSL